MKISIQNQQKHILLNQKKIRKATQIILNELGLLDAELSILLVDDARIQVLNKRYLNRDKPTNVLAFPMREGEFSPLHPHLLGDIVISAEIAAHQSKQFGFNKTEMIIYFILHGILHLIGYEHEGTQKRRRDTATRGRGEKIDNRYAETKKRVREMALKQKELFQHVIQAFKSRK